MRINKRLVPKFAAKKEKYTHSPKVYMDVMYLAGGIWLMFGLIVLMTVTFWSYSYFVASKPELHYFNSRCDILGEGQKHFISHRHDQTSNHNWQCVIGPDWHRVDI